MKKGILILVVLALVALLAYNYFTSGKFTLIPFSPSEEEQELKSLERQLRDAKKLLAEAGRATAMSGVDSTADAEAALQEIGLVARSLSELKKKTGSEEIRRRIEEMEKEIAELERGR